VLPETNKRLLMLLTSMQNSRLVDAASAIHYVDDGSRDITWQLIESFAGADSRVHGIKLSRNRGHQNALLAGLFSVQGDALVSVDADLQDDISVIEEMVRHFSAGSEIVFGVRKSRSSDTVFKRSTATFYYRLLARLGVDLVYNHADFRLMGRRSIDALLHYPEVNLFLRGIVPLLGYRTSTVYYDRAERFAGVSKYPLKRMLAFAIDGITSFSVVPLRLITLLGFLVSALSFFMIVWILLGRFVLNSVIPGWASSVVPIYFLGGIQLLSIGILGEYVAKIYLETKRRPRYFIEKVV
jgi:glycosyltransferase involved in cell wall biosynthesis